MQSKIRFFSLLLLLSLVIGQTIAQSDEVYTGDIDNNRDEDEYVIELDEGDGVIITAIAPDDSGLDTYLNLENEDGNEVAFNDDFEYPDSTNSRIGFVAGDDGEYTIIVSNYPDTAGDYELTIEYVSADEAEEMSTDDSVDIEDIIGDPDLEFDGFVDDDDDDEYDIELDEGDAVVIIAEASSGSALDTFLTLLNEDGDEVAVNDDAIPGEVFDSQIVYVAEEDGDYTIVMSNYPGSEGDYDLTVTFVTEEEAQEVIEASGYIEIDTTPERDPDEEYTGELEDEGDTEEYSIDLDAGDSIIAALYATDGEMDTLMYAIDPDGVELIRNDDRSDYASLDSQVAFTAQESGEYTVVVSHYPDFPGEYRLEIYFADEDEISLAEQANRVLLSGPVEVYDTDNFRIHYTLEGDDATTIDYVEDVAEVVEEVLEIQIAELGWLKPPDDIVQGGDARYDVYLANQDNIYGYADSSSAVGDNSNSDTVEPFAQAAYLVLDNDYAEYDDANRALLATAAHEFHHVVQFGYDFSDMNWYYEATASWMETVTYPDDELATIYVEDVYTYPEACFGGDGDADPSGSGIYGTWLFFEFMTRNLGEESVILLWENIAIEDDWTPLELTLENYDEDLADFVAQYHINNLVRDYRFVDSFDGRTVWLEGIIDDEDDWEPDGDGVQELGANYFEFDMPDGVYNISIDDDDLEIYVLGIDGDDGEVFALGDDGFVDTDDYDDVYVMVFNPDYDDDVSDCDYEDYELTVEEDSGDTERPAWEVDASEFEELEN